MYIAENVAAPGAGHYSVTILVHADRKAAVKALANHLHVAAERPASRGSGRSGMLHAAAEMFQASVKLPETDLPELRIGTRVYRIRKEETSG